MLNGHRPASVLCVDDEQNVLDALTRVLRREFAVTTAQGGSAALEAMRERGPFAVIVSDMRMPGMDGATFLRCAREAAPLSVRILLTGQAELRDAVEAVNQGSIFRFLTKPCAADNLLAVLHDAAEQHRLIAAERVLLEKTLHGSIKALTDILSLIHPAAFGRATRAKQHIGDLAQRMGVSDQWQIEIAAMVSQLGCVTLPPDVAAKVYYGMALSDAEQVMVAGLPETAASLIQNIPRMEPVREIVAYQAKHFDGAGIPADQVSGESIPLGARMLKVVLDFDVLRTEGRSTDNAFATLRSRAGYYDPSVLQAFWDAVGGVQPAQEVLEVPLGAVQPGMVFVEDVITDAGLLLIARGIEMTDALAERVRYLPGAMRVNRPVRVSVPQESAAAASPD